jgi:tRNA threonylcarbamoyl adenosine modification protein YjeE
MGVGKTTFARALLSGLGVLQPPEGSPTFAIAHEYQSRAGDVIHLDLYRLETEDELEEAGIPAYFWERNAIVLVEWLSLFESFGKSIGKTGPVWVVRLSLEEDDLSRRSIRITLESPGSIAW